MRAIEESDLNQLIDELVDLRVKATTEGACLPIRLESYFKCPDDMTCPECKAAYLKGYAQKVRDSIYAKTIKVKIKKE